MSPEGAPRGRRGGSRRGEAPALSDLDLRVLSLLGSQRVLTSRQLSALCPETPERTLRYRCARLARGGLLGRSRPYRERGSAPHHLWPTRRGEALAGEAPPPRGGERREPNPLFLAHAAGLSEIYVSLVRGLPEGARLARFEREGEARETFSTAVGRKGRAIAPDALIEIEEPGGGTLLGFAELDMGTMSRRQLTEKAKGYADYERANAWRERHPFCPALLFVTTAVERARSFAQTMDREIGKRALLLTCACDLARGLDGFAAEARWMVGPAEDTEPVDLIAALREARRPHDEELARDEDERRRRDEERERLRTDPEAFRAELRRRGEPGRRGDRGALDALWVTVRREGPLESPEREALHALAAMMDDPLAPASTREPSEAERRALQALPEHHRRRQEERIEGLRARFGDGPALRRAAAEAAEGELLADEDLERLARDAERDRQARETQELRRAEYLAWREAKARRLAKAQGVFERLRHGPESFLDQVDSEALGLCRGCGEIAYPDPESARAERSARPDVAGRCHYCGGSALAPFEPGEGRTGQ